MTIYTDCWAHFAQYSCLLVFTYLWADRIFDLLCTTTALIAGINHANTNENRNWYLQKSIKSNKRKYFCWVEEEKTIFINLFHNEYSAKVLIIHSSYQQKSVFLFLRGPMGIAIKLQTVFRHILCMYVGRDLFHVGIVNTTNPLFNHMPHAVKIWTQNRHST